MDSDLDLLTQELSGVKQKWYEIGGELGLWSTLDNIRSKYSDVCLREMLKERLQPHYNPTTWRNGLDALRSPYVGQSQLADHLEAKYCPSEFTVTLPYAAADGGTEALDKCSQTVKGETRCTVCYSSYLTL